MPGPRKGRPAEPLLIDGSCHGEVAISFGCRATSRRPSVARLRRLQAMRLLRKIRISPSVYAELTQPRHPAQRRGDSQEVCGKERSGRCRCCAPAPHRPMRSPGGSPYPSTILASTATAPYRAGASSAIAMGLMGRWD